VRICNALATALLLAVAASGPAAAREAKAPARAARPVAASGYQLPAPYRARQPVSGVIRVWGHGAYAKRADFIERLMDAWESGFERYHPGIRFENALKGTAAAMAGLYTGTGDVALMGREVWAPEIEAFKEVKGYPPTGIDVLTGSLATRNRGYALTVFVHKDNPLRSLDLAQLDAVFGQERRRGHKPVRTWGDLGLGGEWRDAPVHLYGLPIARGFADFFQKKVFLGSLFWNPALHEFPDDKGSVSVATDGGTRMAAAMAQDRYAIGYSGLLYANEGIRPVALAPAPGKPAVLPTEATVRDRSYPLTRIITLFIDKRPGQRPDPKVEEFVRFILSREGQRMVEAQGGGYLPVLAPFARKELHKLEN